MEHASGFDILGTGVFIGFLLWLAICGKLLWCHAIVQRLAKWGHAYANRRPPDFSIRYKHTHPGQQSEVYLQRWHVLPRNKLFNVYLHVMLNDDEGAELHDHPWVNLSLVLEGGYYEETKFYPNKPGSVCRHTVWRRPGAIVLRRPSKLHRLSLDQRLRRLTDPRLPATRIMVPVPSLSLFITGPVVRTWGFETKDGWVPFYKHQSRDNSTEDTLQKSSF